MITEDYVSFETAKLLKEKGFGCGDLLYYYDKDGDLLFSAWKVDDCKNEFDAPTLQMAMKWLREVHNIAIETEWEHLWYAYVKPMTSKPSEEDYYQCESPKYEQACEEAVRYCLKNLI